MENLVDTVDTVPSGPRTTRAEEANGAPPRVGLVIRPRRSRSRDELDLFWLDGTGGIQHRGTVRRVPSAPAAVASGAHVIAWRHGYRTALSQALHLLAPLEARGEAPSRTLEDAIRTLQGWLADSR